MQATVYYGKSSRIEGRSGSIPALYLKSFASLGKSASQSLTFFFRYVYHAFQASPRECWETSVGEGRGVYLI